ncbi:MAG TPA: hypothetical protein VMZ71_01760, partial [Gemmataceae bacterium]|nr:hypothetical protein [Gemmataceae bacterium]
MIGEVVASKDRGGCVNVGFFVAAAGSCVIALGAAEVGWAVFAFLPFCLGMAGVLATDPRVEFEVQEEGLQFDKPTEAFVPYESLRGLSGRVLSGGRDFPIQVYHDGGVVRVPGGLNTSSRDLYQFLLEKLPWRAEPDAGPVAPALREFVRIQVDLFGAEKVYVFRPRPFPPVHTRRKHVAYSLGVAAGAALWAAAGGVLELADLKGGGWVASGILFVILGGLVALLFAKAGGGRPTGWQESCLVVSPGGVAMVQGVHRGKLRWDELLSIEYPA